MTSVHRTVSSAVVALLLAALMIAVGGGTATAAYPAQSGNDPCRQPGDGLSRQRVDALDREFRALEARIVAHNEIPHDFRPGQEAALQAYNAEADALNNELTRLRGRATGDLAIPGDLAATTCRTGAGGGDPAGMPPVTTRPPPKTVDSPDLPERAYLGAPYRGEERGASVVFQNSRVRYFDDTDREQARLTVQNGLLYGSDGRPFTSTGVTLHSGGELRSIFVMDGKGNLYASNVHQRGVLHHSSLLAGRPVAGAGEIGVVDGRLRYISDRSGHYRPQAPCHVQVKAYLAREGIDFTGVREGTF